MGSFPLFFNSTKLHRFIAHFFTMSADIIRREGQKYMSRVVVLTSDHYLWALQPFAYLFNRYWSSLQPVTVGGFAKPDYPLPSNFEYISLDSYNYPPEKWSDALIKLLNLVSDAYIVFLLEDYWLCRTVDIRGMDACYDYIQDKPNVLRVDLTNDRLYAGGMRDVEGYGSYDIIETPWETPYQMSLQAGLWNRKLLLELLVPGKTAWETEIHTQPPESMRVLGLRQFPVRYANAILKGKLDREQLKMIPPEHRPALSEMIPAEWRVVKPEDEQ